MKNKYNESEMTEQECLDVSRFTWNAKCTEDQINRMHFLRMAGKDLCQLLIASVPNCADRSSAIRYLRLAIMQGNLAIAHENIKVEK